ncbi:MAG TPA: Rrf2 family transcriptional regulator [bacterium]|nr:Rrf2 family transcriptional regulator [bacterium]
MLKVNRKVEYGLVALKHMLSKPKGQLTSVREICDRFGTPFDPVAHVMRILNAEGLVKSEQGAHGGYRLQDHVMDVTFGDFIEIIEGHALAFTECLREEDDRRCSLIDRCNIVSPMHILHDRMRAFLGSIKLSDLLVDGALQRPSRDNGGHALV